MHNATKTNIKLCKAITFSSCHICMVVSSNPVAVTYVTLCKHIMYIQHNILITSFGVAFLEKQQFYMSTQTEISYNKRKNKKRKTVAPQVSQELHTDHTGIYIYPFSEILVICFGRYCASIRFASQFQSLVQTFSVKKKQYSDDVFIIIN